ncbi:membrane-associated protein, putative [Bodo saltans]|uniref:Membrane-associated protein, putative n=1 Tax=Bodo saltans TaxID=75058 RepID=A0A0S4ILC5_BODSA|nr:membrane-associated protein, putative [Bodo saltans]|eukprot:CUE69924.1 membrane-associated protein, putative [Bodo saltans]
MLPISAVSQPTLTAAVQLIAVRPLEGDVVFGVVGAATVLLLMMAPFTAAIGTQFCLVLVQEVRDKPEAAAGSEPRSVLRQLFHRVFMERATWQPIDATRRDQVAWKKRFAPLFLDCSTWWYPLADMWIGAAVGAVGGLTLGSRSVCFFQLSIVALSYALIAFLQLVVAPPLVLASRCYVVVLQVLGLISCAGVLVAALFDSTDETSASVTTASICMLIIAVISSVKSALDLLFMLLALPGREPPATSDRSSQSARPRTRMAVVSVDALLNQAADDDNLAMSAVDAIAVLIQQEELDADRDPGAFVAHEDSRAVNPIETQLETHAQAGCLEAKSSSLRRVGSARVASRGPADVESGSRNLQKSLSSPALSLRRAGSSMRRPISRDDSSRSLSSATTSFVQGRSAALDEREKSHITKRAGMMLKVDSERAFRRDGFVVHNVEELQRHYDAAGEEV